LCITTKTCEQIQIFKRNSLKNYNDSEFTVKTRNAPFFMNFPSINKRLASFFPLDWSFKDTRNLQQTRKTHKFDQICMHIEKQKEEISLSPRFFCSALKSVFCPPNNKKQTLLFAICIAKFKKEVFAFA
jgi:hypothetical protein